MGTNGCYSLVGGVKHTWPQGDITNDPNNARVAPVRVAKDGWKADGHGARDVNNIYGVVGLLVAGCRILTS